MVMLRLHVRDTVKSAFSAATWSLTAIFQNVHLKTEYELGRILLICCSLPESVYFEQMSNLVH